MNGIIYVRVSSDEQVLGTSLDHQEAVCRKYCEENDIAIIEVYREEGVSAKSADRPKFLRAIEYCRKNRSKVDAFVVAKVDRFARNTEDHFAVRKILHTCGVRLCSVSEPIGEEPTGKLFETILAGFSDFDNAIRRQRCTDGMSAKIDQGLWPWDAPPGYTSQKFKRQGKKKTAPDAVDPVVFPIIQTVLKEFGAGVLPRARMRDRLDALGLAALRGKRTGKTYVERLFREKRLKFYAGLIFNPWTNRDVQGQHEPMLTMDEYHKVRSVLHGIKRTQKRPVILNPKFPLRRTVLCRECDKLYTAGSSRGAGGIYHYYYCRTNGCQLHNKSIPKVRIEEDFLVFLRKLVPSPKLMKLVSEEVQDQFVEESASIKSSTQAHIKSLAALKERRERIYELGEDGTYSNKEFRRRREEIEERISDLEVLISNSGKARGQINGVEFALKFLADLANGWLELSPQLKQQLQKFLFPGGITYLEDGRFRTKESPYVLRFFDGFGGDLTPLVDQGNPGRNGSTSCQQQKIDWAQVSEEIQKLEVLAAAQRVGE